ncbi:hypothetical protein [uncultured Microbulbifer sp.]|uniref:hypothetical protein n=1 Tax=uncultured Microbulbifer sp. TaxID=348147 RepID=UPI00260D34DC|nr:hypothetical protein [uncultured Microbulbifer sp.]
MLNTNKLNDRFPPLQLVACLAVALVFSGCASNSPIPGMQESFETEIAPNGAKRFTFTLKRERRDIPTPIVASSSSQSQMQRRGPMGSGGPSSRRVEAYFDWALEQKLMETGFCERGYFEIERIISPYGGEVRGECREGAF